MASVRRSGPAAALVAVMLAMLAGLPPAPAAATDGDRLDALESLAPAPAPATPTSEATGPLFGFADVHCAQDARGDTFVFVGGEGGNERQDPWPDPRADIVEFCADYDEELTLRLSVAEPTDPTSEWQGQTGAYWYVDLQGDGQFDRAIAYERRGDDLAAVVAHRVEGHWRPLEGCSALATYEGSAGEYTVSGITADCLEDSGRLEVAAVMTFETSGGEVVHDASDHRVATGRAGAPTLRPARRLAGADRYATAVEISRASFPGRAAAVYLARADGFADALAAGSLSASSATAGPVLLVPTCGALPDVVRAEIMRLDPPEVVALGGETAVCDGVLTAAAGAGEAARTTSRLAGDAGEPTRWGTAVAVSRHAYPVSGVEEVYLATGDDFPDALAAGPLDGGPLLLVPSCAPLPDAVSAELARLAPGRVVALGGDAAVCEDVLTEAISAAGSEPLADRLAGATRFDTAAEVSFYRFADGAERVYVARADDFPDALAGAVLEGGPILLVPRCGDLPAAVVREIRRLDPPEVVALGGRGAVCEATLRHAANA
jgi:putative cell wall-binding protein